MDNGTTNYSFSPNKGNEVDKTAMTSPTGEQALDNDIQPNKPDDQETERDLDKPYLEKRSVTINLIANYSFYRRANDKYLPKSMNILVVVLERLLFLLLIKTKSKLIFQI